MAEVTPDESNVREELARVRAALATAERERDAYRADVTNLLPEADAKDWALGEMQIALDRAAKAETENAALRTDQTSTTLLVLALRSAMQHALDERRWEPLRAALARAKGKS